MKWNKTIAFFSGTSWCFLQWLPFSPYSVSCSKMWTQIGPHLNWQTLCYGWISSWAQYVYAALIGDTWAEYSNLRFTVWVYPAVFWRQKISEQFRICSLPLQFSKDTAVLSLMMARLISEGRLQSFSFSIWHISWNASRSLGKCWPSPLAYAGLSIIRISNQIWSQILSGRGYFKVSKTENLKIAHLNNKSPRFLLYLLIRFQDRIFVLWPRRSFVAQNSKMPTIYAAKIKMSMQ